MRKILFIFLTILFIFCLTACSGKGGNDLDSSIRSESDIDEGDHAGDADDIGEDEQNGIQAGQLTAAEWNDNNNYDKWLELFAESENEQGIFLKYLQQWNLNTLNRVIVNVTDDEQAVSGATVKIFKGSDTAEYVAQTDAKGKAYLFFEDIDEQDIFTIKVESNGSTFTEQETYLNNQMEITIDISDSAEKLDKLEIMFVIDTTGSMADELNYLKVEVKDVVNKVKQANPNTDISVALLFYRDIGDQYITRYFAFDDNIENVKESISDQSASGGGDYPEAVHTALSQAVAKQWTSGNSTKLIFHLLDAPPHNILEDMQVYEQSIYTAASKGIRMIPIASSGIDKSTEYLLRNQAMLTGGTYVFLTNESGIGNRHLDPTIEGYVVEYLNALLVRVINEYHTGIHTPPVPYGQQD